MDTTATTLLARSDDVILSQIATAAREVADYRARLATATTPDMIAHYAQRIATTAAQLDVLRTVAGMTGAAARNPETAVAAFAGNGTAV